MDNASMEMSAFVRVSPTPIICDLQALHRVRSRLVSRRTAAINQIRAFLIEQGISVRKGTQALRNSLFSILDLRRDEISERMHDIIIGLDEDWLWLDERIESRIQVSDFRCPWHSHLRATAIQIDQF